jgi:polysaccharide biosynthesis protein PslG
MIGPRSGLAAPVALGFCWLACFAPAAGAEHASSGRPASVPPLGGINIPGPSGGATSAEADRAVAEAKALHAKIVRVEVPWSDVQPTGPGANDPKALAYTDRVVHAAAADGIHVILLLDGTPCWASSAPARLRRKCVSGRSSKANSWPPTKPADFASFASYLASRYGTLLTAIEVWNEPDQANEDYFAGPHKAEHYAALLRAAYPAIKQANPQVSVLAGSLVGSNGVFLRSLYAAGIKGFYDGLAVHFYTLTLAAVRAIHEVQLANGDTTPLWLDEFGWSSCWPRHRTELEQGCVTAQTQAANFTDVFRSLATTPYIAAEVVFKLQDSPGEAFGVLTASGARKPSFAALSRVLASPFGRVHPVTVHLRRNGGRVIASGSGPVGDYMQLDAYEGSVLRYRAVFTLDRFNRYTIAVPRVLGAHGLRVRVYQDWTGPGRSAQKSI